MEHLPVKLGKDPIIDAIIEIRFDAGVNPNAVFGMVYAQIQKLFPGEILSFPISQMPMEIVDRNPELRFNPSFKVDGDKSSIQIGPHVIAINSHMPYIGWEQFFELFKEVVNKVYVTIGQIQRLGLRYINFFEQDVHEQVDVDIKIASTNCNNFLLKAKVDNDDDLSGVVQYTPNATVNNGEGSQLIGAVIDIDVSKNYEQGCDKDVLLEDVQRAHNSEKALFFSLLKPDLLEKLKPNY